MREVLAIVAAMVTSVGALAQPEWAEPRADDTGGMSGVVGLMAADLRSVESFFDLAWEEERFTRIEALLEARGASLGGIDFGALPPQGRIDWLLLRGWIGAQREEVKLSRARLEEMGPLLPFREVIVGLTRAEREMREGDPRSSAAAISEIEGMIKGVRARVDAARAGQAPEGVEPLVVSAVVARRTAGAVQGLRSALREWYDYYAAYQPDFAWWVSQPHEEASKALDEYARYLRETIAGEQGKPEDPLIGDPIGRDKLLADLAYECIPYTPEELVTIAEREFAWCESQMLLASREMGHGEDWRGALEEVKQASLPPGEQTHYVTGVALEAIQFLKDRELVTIPPLCEELWRLRMISAENQRIWPFAYYGGQHIGVAAPADRMEHDDKLQSMRGNNRHFTRIVVPHELIPGHHLQGYMARRERPYRGVFATPFFGEGWALYWEMTLWDKGFAQSPEDRVGMLFWRMHRCARIIVSLKFHLGEMTPQEMIDFLVDRVGHERFGATSEVRRYIGGEYSPLYQCAYMLGGMQLRALRRELVDTGVMTEMRFHDALLSYNSMPIELVRAGMLGMELSSDWSSSWRFAEPNE